MDDEINRARRANRGRVLVAKVGLDGHDRGAKVVSRLLMEENFEVVFVGVRHTPDQVAEIARDEEVDVVGLSLLSGAHVALSEAVRRSLDERGLTHVPIALGGLIPKSDADALKSAGVALVVHPGESLLDTKEIAASIDDLVTRSRNDLEANRQ